MSMNSSVKELNRWGREECILYLLLFLVSLDDVRDEISAEADDRSIDRRDAIGSKFHP